MISRSLFEALEKALSELEESEVLDNASWETMRVMNALLSIDYNTTHDDRAQTLEILTQLQKVLDYTAQVAATIALTKSQIQDNPELQTELEKNSEVGMSEDDVEINVELRNSFTLFINTIAFEVGESIGMRFSRKKTVEPNEVIAAINNNQTNFQFKSFGKFKSLGDLTTADSSGKFSHETARVQKAPKISEPTREKHQAIWFRKLVEERKLAGREVIAQEFFRLLMPYQPKTRIVADDTDQLFVISKGATDATCLQDLTTASIREGLLNNSIKNFGKVSISNLFLNETDAKAGNMYVDNKNGNLVKIDGDWCFAALRSPARFADKTNISAGEIASLPLVPHYGAYNWMDLHIQGTIFDRYVTHPDKVTIAPELSKTPAFRQEVNEGLLHILLMTADLRQKFITSYIHDPKEIKLLANEMAERYTQTYQAAMKDPSFQIYMHSPAAFEYMHECAKLTGEFKTTGKNYLAPDVFALIAEFETTFQQIKAEAIPRAVNSSSMILDQLAEAKLAEEPDFKSGKILVINYDSSDSENSDSDLSSSDSDRDLLDSSDEDIRVYEYGQHYGHNADELSPTPSPLDMPSTPIDYSSKDFQSAREEKDNAEVEKEATPPIIRPRR